MCVVLLPWDALLINGRLFVRLSFLDVTNYRCILPLCKVLGWNWGLQPLLVTHPGLSPCEHWGRWPRESNTSDADEINACYFWLWCTSSIFKRGGGMVRFFYPSSFHSVEVSQRLFPKETGFRSGLSYIYSLVPISWTPLSTRVWFHVLDCKISYRCILPLCQVLGWNEASSRCWWYHPYFLVVLALFRLLSSPSPSWASCTSCPQFPLGLYTHTLRWGLPYLGVLFVRTLHIVWREVSRLHLLLSWGNTVIRTIYG